MVSISVFNISFNRREIYDSPSLKFFPTFFFKLQGCPSIKIVLEEKKNYATFLFFPKLGFCVIAEEAAGGADLIFSTLKGDTGYLIYFVYQSVFCQKKKGDGIMLSVLLSHIWNGK